MPAKEVTSNKTIAPHYFPEPTDAKPMRPEIVSEMNMETEGAPPIVTDEMVAERAYELWEECGRPEGCDLQHWLQAETELKTQTSSDR